MRAIAIAGPAVPFVGIPVLGAIYPTDADIAVAAGSLIMNNVQVHVCLVLLMAASGETGAAQSPLAQLGHILVNTVKKAVVWAPLLAFALILVGVDLPKEWEGSFTLLGQATGALLSSPSAPCSMRKNSHPNGP